jgi:hypothetical protein
MGKKKITGDAKICRRNAVLNYQCSILEIPFSIYLFSSTRGISPFPLNFNGNTEFIYQGKRKTRKILTTS